MLNWLRTVGLLGLAKPRCIFVSVRGTIPGSLGPRNGIEVFVLPLVRGSSCSPFFFVLCAGCGVREAEEERGKSEGAREGETRGEKREGRMIHSLLTSLE